MRRGGAGGGAICLNWPARFRPPPLASCVSIMFHHGVDGSVAISNSWNLEHPSGRGRGQGEKGRGGRGYEMFVDYFHWSIWPELGNRKWKQTAANGTWLDSLCVCVCVCVSVCVCVCVSRRLSSVIGSVSWSISAATETVERKRLLNGWLINGTGNWIMEACGMTSSAHAGLTKRTWRTDQREGRGGREMRNCAMCPSDRDRSHRSGEPESHFYIRVSAAWFNRVRSHWTTAHSERWPRKERLLLCWPSQLLPSTVQCDLHPGSPRGKGRHLPLPTSPFFLLPPSLPPVPV